MIYDDEFECCDCGLTYGPEGHGMCPTTFTYMFVDSNGVYTESGVLTRVLYTDLYTPLFCELPV